MNCRAQSVSQSSSIRYLEQNVDEGNKLKISYKIYTSELFLLLFGPGDDTSSPWEQEKSCLDNEI